MLSDLQAENQALRRQLEALLREARSNEDKMRRFEQLEHRLIGAASVLELLRLLLGEYKLAFGIEAVTLTLLDPEQEIRRILESELREPSAQLLAGLDLSQSAFAMRALYGDELQPWLGAFDATSHAGLFDAADGPLASVALLPLSRHGELIGSLHFGSRSAERYDAAAGTRFLERLADIVAVCLESALNQERLKLAGLTDMLTGVHNRRYFEHRCGIEIAQARRYRHPLACMFLDIDHFKRINDTHGHQTGDEVLRTIGEAIRSQLRAGDTIARYGGEEFVVLLPRTPGFFAREIAERIRASIAERRLLAASGDGIGLTISIGLAMLGGETAGQSPGKLAERLVASADQALYAAKHGGRNRVVCDAPESAVWTEREFVGSA